MLVLWQLHIYYYLSEQAIFQSCCNSMCYFCGIFSICKFCNFLWLFLIFVDIKGFFPLNLFCNCQNPNSTISSIQLSLSLDYILTLWSTTTPHKLNLYTQNWQELTTAQLARRDLLYKCDQWSNFLLRFRGRTKGERSSRPLDNFSRNHIVWKKKKRRTPGPDFVQMLLWTV